MLHVQNIRRQFGGIRAVDDVSFDVREGEVVSLIGPNGAGKTTCFNLITGFIQPTAGSVLFQGADIVGRPAPEIAARGLVRTFQKTNVLLNLTVFENVLAAQYCRGRTSLLRTFFPGRAERAADRGMRDHAARVIDQVGLGPRVNTAAGELACGELRLLEIAVGLGAMPRLLMLDEPAAGLNTAQAARLGELLRSLVGTTLRALLLVEHNMSLVMSVSDRVVVMNSGRKLMEGTPDEVRAHPEVIEAYLGTVAPAGAVAPVGAVARA